MEWLNKDRGGKEMPESDHGAIIGDLLSISLFCLTPVLFVRAPTKHFPVPQ